MPIACSGVMVPKVLNIKKSVNSDILLGNMRMQVTVSSNAFAETVTCSFLVNMLKEYRFQSL